MSPARARTRTARTGVEHTNHEATAPPTRLMNECLIPKKNEEQLIKRKRRETNQKAQFECFAVTTIDVVLFTV